MYAGGQLNTTTTTMNPVSHHSVPQVSLGQLPTIGMVTAPGSGGHVGIGIGIPIMTAGPLLQQSMPAQQSTHHRHHHHHELVSPDSSEDGLLHHHRTQSPILPGPSSSICQHHGSTHTLPPSWSAAPFLTGMGYPLMGMGSGSLLGEPSMYYGINLVSTHPQHNPGAIQGPHDLSGIIPHTMPPTNPMSSSPLCSSLPGQSPLLPQQSSTILSTLAVNANKEIIHCKSCTLFPPNPAAPLPTTREKPNGCRTIFVGGLPENMTDEIIREIFEPCGEITTIRMSKKNFCHVRFELESYVESAIYLSGYRIRIGSNSDNANIGRFHVDFAQARDDFFEWECRQRQLQREQRHRDRLEQERLLPPSPPPIVHYSDHEAIVLADNIKVDENFMKSVQILIAWLERGDCIKRNATSFYSMVQSTHSHVKRLLNEKAQYEDELQKAKILANQRTQGLSMQFVQVEKVFLAASHKKAWDHFTKAQRKNIDIWKKQANEMQNMKLNILDDQGDEEMDLSDSDSEESVHLSKKIRLNSDSYKSIDQLKEENDSLRCQLEAFKNEVDLIKADLKSELEVKDNELQLLQEKLHLAENSSEKVIQLSPTQSDTEIVSSQSISIELEIIQPPNHLGLENNCDSSTTIPRSRNHSNNINTPNSINEGNNRVMMMTTQEGMIPETEAKLIGIISTFLHVHPFGVSIDYICSFVQKLLPGISTIQIMNSLLKFPGIFRQEFQLPSVNGDLEHRTWKFIGFSHKNA